MAKPKKNQYNDNNYAIAYYRYSSHAQNDASIEQQREKAKQYAEEHGLKIIAEYEDRGITGTTDNRPEFQKMLYEVSDLKPSILITYKMDRISRDRKIYLDTKYALAAMGVKLAFVAESLPEDCIESILLESVLSGLNEYYSKNLSNHVKRGMNYNAEHALYNGVKLYGYIGKAGEKYQIDEDRAPIIQDIFMKYASGVGLSQIARDLDQKGIKSMKGGKMTINSLRSILHNRAYIGEYKFGDIVIPDGIPAIITSELFEEVQRRFKINQKGSGSTVADYWLTGYLYCGECNGVMRGLSGTSKTGKTYFYYACSEKLKYPRIYPEMICDKKNVPKDSIENAVIFATRAILREPENLTFMFNQLQDIRDNSIDDTENYIKILNDNLNEVNSKLLNLNTAIANGIFGDSTKNMLLDLETRKKELETNIKELELQSERTRARTITDNQIIEYLKKYSLTDSDINNIELVKKIVHDLFYRIYVFDDKLVFTTWFTDNYEVKLKQSGEVDTETFEFVNLALSSTINTAYPKGYAVFILWAIRESKGR